MRPMRTAVKTDFAFPNLVGSPPAVMRRNPPIIIRMIATTGTGASTLFGPEGSGMRKNLMILMMSPKTSHSPHGFCPGPPHGISSAAFATNGKRANTNNVTEKKNKIFFIC